MVLNRRVVVTLLATSFTVALLALLIRSGYGQSWTGFQSYVSKGEIVPAKKLWDWMSLLVVPLGLAIAAFYLNKRQKETELRKTTNQQQEASLQAFITQMSELLLKENLRSSKPDDGARTIARARALTVLKELDGKRKGLMIRFLIESRLLQKEGKTIEEEIYSPIISLVGADLTGADLSKVDLSKVVFEGVDLTGANFEFSKLMKMERDVNTKLDHKWDLVWKLGQLWDRPKKDSLRGQDLRNADLTGVDLHNYDLRGTDLRGAILNRAELSGTRTNYKTKLDAKWRHIWKAINNKNDVNRFSGDLSHSNFAYQVFHKQDLSKCDFEGALFRSTQFIEVNMERVSAFDADFSRADVQNSNLCFGQLALVSFADAELTDTVMSTATLTWANFQGAVLRNVDLSKADLKMANLCGADLSGANLTDAEFEDSDYDEKTRWPAGFDPKQIPGLVAAKPARSPITAEAIAAMSIELLNVPD